MKVGQHVECIKDHFVNQDVHKKIGVIYPRKGTIYTIREIIPAHLNPTKGVPLSLRLEEIKNTTVQFTNGTFEPFFSCHRFRPLHKLKAEDFLVVKDLSELARV
ncbi:hypothetical protein [Brucella thiophenivorans]|uniref:Uncharacterized protein n=1 Tax=Brucella thiophenivorans TaxID=571255 RepID=A0A256G1G1_9HYPH|nr:hypothetical protein [Brucella thiophenivorans]OYR20909.1 hypothetical protein CEV31_0878 [Brucella thiophenivorans]